MIRWQFGGAAMEGIFDLCLIVIGWKVNCYEMERLTILNVWSALNVIKRARFILLLSAFGIRHLHFVRDDEVSDLAR